MLCVHVQAVVQVATLRHGIAVLGGDGDAGSDLPDLLAQCPVAPGVAAVATPGAGLLADLLSPGQLGHVLQLEAETVVCLMGRTGPGGGM